MRLVTLDSGQFALPWYCDHLSAILKARHAAKMRRRELAAKLKRERAGMKYMLSLMEIGESIGDEDAERKFCLEDYLSASEIELLDEYIAYKTKEIRDAWTPEQEAAARGVMQRKADRFFVSDGRLFQQSLGIQVVGGDEWGEFHDESE